MTINQRTFAGIAMSVKEFLSANGVPVISNEQILKHEKATLRQSRVGIWKWLWVIPLVFVRIQDLMIGNLPPGCAVLNRSEYFRLTRPVVMTLIVLALLFAGLGFYLTGSLIGLIPGVIIGLILPFGLVHLVQKHLPNSGGTEQFLQAGRYWQDVTYKLYEDHGRVPARIRARVEVIRTLFADPLTSILVRRFAGDPLIFVVVNQERICFGAWDTGTELDEI